MPLGEVPVPRHYRVCTENQALGMTANPRCGRPEVGAGGGLAVAIIACWRHSPCTMWRAFIFLLTLLVHLLRAVCKSRDELVLENLALRQQVATLELGKHNPKLHNADRAFWIALRKTWGN